MIMAAHHSNKSPVPLIDRSLPPSVYSLPPFCLHRSPVLPEDKGTWRAAAPEGGGPVERRQVGRVNWAGASHAQIHRAQHHRQVSPQQHGGEPATQRTAQKTMTWKSDGWKTRGRKRL